MRPRLRFAAQLLVVACWCFARGARAAPATVTGSYGIKEADDDAEQQLMFGTLSTLYLDSNDYEFMYDMSTFAEQLIALRWQDVRVPNGAVIVDAVLQFTGDSDVLAGVQGGSLSVAIGFELVGDSPGWSTVNAPSQRSLAPPAVWSIADLWTDGMPYNSTSVAAGLQSVVSLPSWAPGNSVSAVLRRSGSSTSTDLRIASAYEGRYEAARLLVEYTPPPTPAPSPAPDTGSPATVGPPASVVVGSTAAPVATGAPGPSSVSPAPVRHSAAPAVVAASSAIAVAGALAGTSTGHATRLALLFGDCSEDLQGSFSLHPTQVTVRGDYFAGAVLGNLGLAAAAGALGALGILLLKCAPGPPGNKPGWAGWLQGTDELGMLRMPSVSLCVFALLYPGTTLAAAHLLVHQDDPWLAALGAGVLVVHLAVPVAVCLQIRAAVPQDAYYCVVAAPRRSRLAAVLFGPGEWVSVSPRYHFAARYASVLRPYTQPAAAYFLADCLCSFALAAIQSVEATWLTDCGHVKLCMGLVLGLMTAAECKLSPQARPRDSVLFVVVFGGQSAGLLLEALSFYQGHPDDATPAYWGHRAAEFLLSITAFLMLVKALLDVACEAYLIATRTRGGIQAKAFASPRQGGGGCRVSLDMDVSLRGDPCDFSSPNAHEIELGEPLPSLVATFSGAAQNHPDSPVAVARRSMSPLPCAFNALAAPASPLVDLVEQTTWGFSDAGTSLLACNNNSSKDPLKQSLLLPCGHASASAQPAMSPRLTSSEGPDSPKAFMPRASSYMDLSASQRLPYPAAGSPAHLRRTPSASRDDSPRSILRSHSSAVDLTANPSLCSLRSPLFQHRQLLSSAQPPQRSLSRLSRTSDTARQPSEVNL
ncbi:Purple acid phosphatase 7 [Diplonema papillatum]|nr:Purple acid phosphatase 7 [Diplonema papillatum]|eukprot:gene7125-10981_t